MDADDGDAHTRTPDVAGSEAATCSDLADPPQHPPTSARFRYRAGAAVYSPAERVMRALHHRTRGLRDLAAAHSSNEWNPGHAYAFTGAAPVAPLAPGTADWVRHRPAGERRPRPGMCRRQRNGDFGPHADRSSNGTRRQGPPLSVSGRSLCAAGGAGLQGHIAERRSGSGSTPTTERCAPLVHSWCWPTWRTRSCCVSVPLRSDRRTTGRGSGPKRDRRLRTGVPAAGIDGRRYRARRAAGVGR
jgi:hypothetical protein